MAADVLQENAERIEALLQRFDALPAATGARADADKLMALIGETYGEALRRLLENLHTALGERAHEVLVEACNDTLITALLVTHDLHPLPLEERVRRAIDSVRPYMRSHKGDVEILGVAEDAVEVRLSGTCDGCSASQATLKQAIEKALFAAAPEVLEVRAAPATAPEHGPPAGVLPVIVS
ncbi:MAG: NifU family protein [Candidatus Baltobacteraceae bacterium]